MTTLDSTTARAKTSVSLTAKSLASSGGWEYDTVTGLDEDVVVAMVSVVGLVPLSREGRLETLLPCGDRNAGRDRRATPIIAHSVK